MNAVIQSKHQERIVHASLGPSVRHVGVQDPAGKEAELDGLRALREAADVGGVERVRVDVEVEVVSPAPPSVNVVVFDDGHSHDEAVALLVPAEDVQREDLGRGRDVGETVLQPHGLADRVEPVDLGRVVSPAVHEARRGLCRHFPLKSVEKRTKHKSQFWYDTDFSRI